MNTMSATCRQKSATASDVLDLQRLALDASIHPSLAQGGCRVGVDIVYIHDVAESIERFGERYLKRVFTDQERASCTGTTSVIANGLAARFAAKEAAVKVLQPVGAQPDWRSMEVVKQASGACELEFRGRAAELAAASGLHSPAVSLSHEGDFAIAIVVVLTNESSHQDLPEPGRTGPAQPPTTSD